MITTSHFTHEGGRLLRHVTPRSGRSYIHSCGLDIFEAVAHEIGERPDGTTIVQLAGQMMVPMTQIAVAVGFLNERGLLERMYPRRFGSLEHDGLHLSAMIEWHAIAYGGGA